MITLNRAHMSQRRAFHYDIDVTVKSGSGLGKAMAPTWAMVMGHKQGKITDAEYTAQYIPIMRRALMDGKWLNELLGLNVKNVCFLCYCRDGKFCHSHLLIDHLLAEYPDLFLDGRTKTVQLRLL